MQTQTQLFMELPQHRQTPNQTRSQFPWHCFSHCSSLNVCPRECSLILSCISLNHSPTTKSTLNWRLQSLVMKRKSLSLKVQTTSSTIACWLILDLPNAMASTVALNDLLVLEGFNRRRPLQQQQSLWKTKQRASLDRTLLVEPVQLVKTSGPASSEPVSNLFETSVVNRTPEIASAGKSFRWAWVATCAQATPQLLSQIVPLRQAQTLSFKCRNRQL